MVEDAVIETLVPESLRELIEQQYDGLGAEAQQVLAAASVAGGGGGGGLSHIYVALGFPLAFQA